VRILILGNGFLATSIIHRLETEGHNIRVFSRKFKDSVRSKQILGDIFDFNEFVRVISWNPDVIIHTAWVTTQGVYAHDPSNHNYSQFTSNLAKFIAQSEVQHMIVLGSCAEYGPQNRPSVAGITKLSPNSVYGEQKVAAFRSARDLLCDSSVRLSWVRIFQPFGPGQDKRRLLPQLIEALKGGQKVVLKDTSSVHDWITTRDIASIISWIIRKNTPIEIDAGTGIGYTNVQLLRHLENFFENSNQWKRFEVQDPGTALVTIVGNDSPLFLSGWQPSDSLDSGIKWVLDS